MQLVIPVLHPENAPEDAQIPRHPQPELLLDLQQQRRSQEGHVPRPVELGRGPQREDPEEGVLFPEAGSEFVVDAAHVVGEGVHVEFSLGRLDRAVRAAASGVARGGQVELVVSFSSQLLESLPAAT